MTDFASELTPTLFGTQLNALVAQVAALLPLSGTFGTDTGTANAGAITLTPAPTSLTPLIGQTIVVLKEGAANTGPYTLNVNGLGAKAVHKQGASLIGSELPASAMFTVVWDGTAFELTSAQGQILPSDLAQIAAGTLFGNLSGGSAQPSAITLVALAAALGIPTALSGSQSGTPGADGWKASINLPVPGIGTVLINMGITSVGGNLDASDTFLTPFTTVWGGVPGPPGTVHTDSGNQYAASLSTTGLTVYNGVNRTFLMFWVVFGVA